MGRQASVKTLSAPMELPRLVMRGALVVFAFALVLALVFGLWRARQDMRDELAAATALAQLSGLLVDAQTRSDDELLGELRALQSANASRHLQVRLLDGAGHVRFESQGQAPTSPVLRVLVALNDGLFTPPPSQRISVKLPRPEGSAWTMQWIASHVGEQREALSQLADDMATLAGCATVMLLVMHWNIRRSFRPLAPLLAAIGRVEQHDVSAMRSLPTMPIRELDAIAGALRHLAVALEQAESRRRVLGAQVLTLQEDERSRIARELHDELGQHLTALRADAAWLQRRLADEPEIATVVAGMSEQCAHIQRELRALLTRLRPLGQGEINNSSNVESVRRLRGLLETLVQSWSDSPGSGTRYSLDFRLLGIADDVLLPLDLVLTVYRISQEALTNVARHARATDASLRITLQRDERGGSTDHGVLTWTVQDNGCGMNVASAWHRGNGLAGIKERVWAAGGNLESQSPIGSAATSPGLALRAQLAFPVIPVATTAEAPR